MPERTKRKVLVLLDFEEHRDNWDYVEVFHQILRGSEITPITVSNQRIEDTFTPGFAFTFIDLENGGDRKVFAALRELARDVEYILALGDWTAEWVIRLNQELQLPGVTEAQLSVIGDKYNFYEWSRQHGIQVPRSRTLQTAEDLAQAKLDFNHPILIKPTRSTGGSKMRTFDYKVFGNLDEICERLDRKGNTYRLYKDDRGGGKRGHHMIQDYVEPARLLMVNFVLLEGRAEILQTGRLFFDKPKKIKPFAVGAPETLPKDVEAEIHRILNLYMTHLKLNSTFGSIQFVLDAKGELHPIDFHFRLGESLGILLLLYDANLWLTALRGLLGEKVRLSTQTTPVLKRGIALDLPAAHRVEVPKPTDSRLRVCNLNARAFKKMMSLPPENRSLRFYLTVGRMESNEACWETSVNFLRSIRTPRVEVSG